MPRLRTKIVCTIGPATDDASILRQMILAGMNVARLNFSHGDQEYHGENIARIRQSSAALDRPVAILIDLQGPKLRVGDLGADGLQLEAGETLVLTNRPITGHPADEDDDDGRPATAPLQYANLPDEVHPGDRILMDDGLLEARVQETNSTDILCRMVVGGLLKSNKGLNLPNAALSIPAITEKDWNDLEFALSAGADWVALSFVRSAEQVLLLKQRIAELCQFGRPAPVVAKIEKPEAVEQIDAIIAAADAIMIARGDLGIETAPEKVPMVQKMIIGKCNSAGIPVHRHSDARLDDAQSPSHPRRSLRRRQCHPRRYRRRHALRRDRHRPLPAGNHSNHGQHRPRGGKVPIGSLGAARVHPAARRYRHRSPQPRHLRGTPPLR